MLVVMIMVINYTGRMCLSEVGYEGRNFLRVISIDCGICCFEPSGSASNGIVNVSLSSTFLFNQMSIDVSIT